MLTNHVKIVLFRLSLIKKVSFGILLITFVFLSTLTKAVVNNYIFSSSVANYLPISGTVLFSGTWDDENSTLLIIPFSFIYNGNTFNTVGISSNGFLTLGDVTPISYCGLQESGPNSIAAYGTDLMGHPGSTVEYVIEGAAPNRKFIVQWKDCAHYPSLADHYNFQILLHERTNMVEIKYGSFLVQSITGANNCSTTLTSSGDVGLKGNSATDINIRSVTDGINDWNSSISGINISTVCNLAPTNFPSQGLTYKWTAPTLPKMKIVSVKATAVNKNELNLPSTINHPMVKIEIQTIDSLEPIIINSISFNTAGSSFANGDISEANLYYTGSVDSFTTSKHFWYSISEAEGNYTIPGHETLTTGSNYFWLAYDISYSAIDGDTVAACISAIQYNDTEVVALPCQDAFHIIAIPSLKLTVFFEGLYIGNGLMRSTNTNYPQVCDSATIEFHDTIYPYEMTYSTTGIINIDGKGVFHFPGQFIGQRYYIVVRHRYSIATWSKEPVLFNTVETKVDLSRR